jgi:hypothetical protein
LTTVPYARVERGNLFITPVGPSIAEVPYPKQAFDKPPDYSLWVRGEILEPGPHLDRARMSPRLYQEVRDDLTRFSPVEVTRSAIRRSTHAYVGVIDSRGVPYYFALDSRGVSVREADDTAWKAFDRLATDEHMAAVRQRRSASAREMHQVDRELSEPVLFVAKGIKYGKKTEWRGDVPHSSWWRNTKRKKDGKEPSGDAEVTEKAEVDASTRAGLLYVSEFRRIDAELAAQASESDLDPPRPEDLVLVDKALPKKSKERETKKTPSRKASKKQAGAGGKTRYTYLNEKKGGKSGVGGQVPLVVEHDDTKHADPAELANQLGVSMRTLQHTARRLGADGFSTFMRARLKTFAQKHRLDPDYWNTLYAALVAGGTGGEIAKGDASKKFGDDVKEAASAVPADHHERFGDRRVFIHHVHSEMKRHGTYSKNLDEFKRDVISAHRNGHLTAARADFVQAMDPNSVKQAETKTDGAEFHFINNVKHNPETAKKFEAKPVEVGSKTAGPKSKMSPKFHREVAHALSRDARDATAHAEKMRTPEAHLAAMAAHHQAGAQHQKVSGKVNHKVALAHFDQSMTHLKAAKARD